MTSTTVCFSHDQGLASADEFLRDSGGEMLSVVDGDGKLLGTIPAEQLRSGEACQELPATVGERLAGDAAVYEEETTVQTLYEFFQHSDAERVEIVHAGRPSGFVSRGSLAALGERLTPGHFAAIRPPAQASDYLLVADLG
jgi:hypothetical protein